MGDGWNIGDVLWHDNQVQRADTLMCWTQDSLRQTEQIKKFGQTNTVGVARVLNMDVEAGIRLPDVKRMHWSVHMYVYQACACQTPDTADQFTSQPVATRRATLLITHSSLPSCREERWTYM